MNAVHTSWHRHVVAVVLAALTTVLVAGPVTAAARVPSARATLGTDDYPYKNVARGMATTAGQSMDAWRFYNGFCTSFVAWRINDLEGKSDWADHHASASDPYWSFTNFMPKAGGGTVQFGDADNWATAAGLLGWTVNSTPTVGSIAQYNAFEGDASNSASGHVAVVTKTYSDGKVDVEEYNWTNPGAYDTRIHVAAPRYIHVPGVPTNLGGDVSVTPFSTSSAYVKQTYSDVLSRQPTSTELSTWAGKINTGTDPGQLVSTLVGTDPFNTASAQTVRMYLAYFQRGPDVGGYQYWLNRLVSGSATTWYVSQTFALSDEFKATYGSLDNPSFVDLIYKNVLNRTADAGGRAFWIDQLNQGMTRGAVMTNFSESAENISVTQPKVGVARLYLALFQRTPDAGGWASWTGQVAQGMSIAALADVFRQSAEYAKRVTG